MLLPMPGILTSRLWRAHHPREAPCLCDALLPLVGLYSGTFVVQTTCAHGIGGARATVDDVVPTQIRIADIPNARPIT